MITAEIAESIDQSVLCWLATISEDGFPNVSPKEAFLYDGEGKILVANIASPVTAQNIERASSVCLSFVNIFIQKGYKIKGHAKLITSDSLEYEDSLRQLTEVIGTAFPIISIIEITPVSIEEITAPSYYLYPQTGPLDRIRESLQTYKVTEYQQKAEQDV